MSCNFRSVVTAGAFAFAEKKIAAIFASQEAAEGMAAFAQKRPPRWVREN